MLRNRFLLSVVAVVIVWSLVAARRGRSGENVNPSQALELQARVPARVQKTLQGACFDCHSANTRWPWYSRLPVASWLINRDVTSGRAQLDFSRWGQYNPFDRADLLDKICERATGRAMPPWQYRIAHADARLTAADIGDMCAWADKEATRLVQGGS